MNHIRKIKLLKHFFSQKTIYFKKVSYNGTEKEGAYIYVIAFKN